MRGIRHLAHSRNAAHWGDVLRISQRLALHSACLNAGLLGEILDAPEATACPISCSIGWMNDLTKYPKRVTRESQRATSWIGSQTCSAFGIELMWCYQRVKGACRTLAEKSYFYFLNLHWQRKTRKHAKENGRRRLNPRRHHQSRAGSPTVGLGLSVIKFPFLCLFWFVGWFTFQVLI